MTLDWGDVPTWLASIGTVAAVWLALSQILADRRTVRAHIKRSQAELVAAWYAGDRGDASLLVVSNTSTQPVFNGHGGEGVPPDYRRVFLEVPPGTFEVAVSSHWHGMSATPGAEVAFTDRTGRANWIRRANGDLEEGGESAIEHYDIGRPFDYDIVNVISDERSLGSTG
jgi:hypothetical protein